MGKGREFLPLKICAVPKIFRTFVTALRQPFGCHCHQPRLERCRSGRSGRSRKPLSPCGDPGFESLSFRDCYIGACLNQRFRHAFYILIVGVIAGWKISGTNLTVCATFNLQSCKNTYIEKTIPSGINIVKE